MDARGAEGAARVEGKGLKWGLSPVTKPVKLLHRRVGWRSQLGLSRAKSARLKATTEDQM
jgi:hypothetical protein